MVCLRGESLTHQTNQIKLFNAIATAAVIGGSLFATVVPETKAGAIYWNNNGGGAIVINRGYYYGPRGHYIYSPPYHRRRGFIAGPNGV